MDELVNMKEIAFTLPVSGELTGELSILPDHLIYVDSPFEGYVQLAGTSEIFVFRVFAIVPNHSWHWVLIPACSATESVEKNFLAARVKPPERWVSLIEDHREGQPCLYASVIRGEKVPESAFLRADA